MAERQHLRRLSRVWIPSAVYFITICTYKRRSILVSPDVAAILRCEWKTAKERHGWLIGRYVIMPDHVHFFCAEQAEGAKYRLSRFIGGWKEWTAKSLCQDSSFIAPIWQERFFDHLLRSDESYAEKWAYVRENPVRADLISSWETWPWQGVVNFDFPGSL